MDLGIHRVGRVAQEKCWHWRRLYIVRWINTCSYGTVQNLDSELDWTGCKNGLENGRSILRAWSVCKSGHGLQWEFCFGTGALGLYTQWSREYTLPASKYTWKNSPWGGHLPAYAMIVYWGLPAGHVQWHTCRSTSCLREFHKLNSHVEHAFFTLRKADDGRLGKIHQVLTHLEKLHLSST